MNRRKFFSNFAFAAGALLLPEINAPSFKQAETFNPHTQMECPGCGGVMWTTRTEAGIVHECTRGPFVFNDGSVSPACHYYGVKFLAPRVEMERV